MKPLLQQLENESLLLLYMADELPPQDREELELMLSRDGGLRAQLEALRGAQGSSFAALAQLDAAEPLRAFEPVMRQVNRSMEQWRIDRILRPAKTGVSKSKMPIWAWSVGSAVAALMVFCIWWGFRSDVGTHDIAGTQPNGHSSMNGEYAVNGDPTNGIPDENSSDISTDRPRNGLSNRDQVVSADASTQRLGELESVVSEDFARE
jgi:hypothetical protein